MSNLRDVFQLLTVFFLFTLFYGGQAQDDPLSQSVMVMLGDDVILPCQLTPPMDAVSMTIEWGRPDLNPRFVFVWHMGQELVVDQNEAYKNRASLSKNKLKSGDLSLSLLKTRISDNGVYRCYIPKQSKAYFVQLLVGAASSLDISLAGIDQVNGGVMLGCESKGWYPEPEVLWVDSKGKVLPAGRTEIVKGPDGLLTVSSRVTVEKRHSNIFTCRVHQKDINQTRETQIHVPDDFFIDSSSCAASTVFSVLFGLLFIAAVGLMVWKEYKNEWKMCRNNKDGEAKESKLLSKEDEKALKEELLGDMTQVIETLGGLTEDLEEQKKQISSQIQGAEKQAEETDEKIRLVGKEVEEKGGDKTAKKAQGYLKLREILQEVNWNQEEKKQELQQLHMNIEQLMKKTMNDVNIIKEKKNTVESQVEQIKKQIEEMEKQRVDSESEKGGETQHMMNPVTQKPSSA